MNRDGCLQQDREVVSDSRWPEREGGVSADRAEPAMRTTEMMHAVPGQPVAVEDEAG
ncbi:hypothetical protein GGTG_08081 [Gaeumannomyces tritici R3-111a-1]|uniref:Uncharacterized protein n=1 Tax=Gaeumannomyces tritici (strain R3-111a-1) TaxID=644352 RepID=J3P3J5_GAET3|nr:hypothetical protein GGTG_08081 [Gaeumannomyces tritici R3-111a-1]EJT74238.1 hypothetical protein GGTG_08081 [Gaeumannomyces tritici R3-111a-1]